MQKIIGDTVKEFLKSITNKPIRIISSPDAVGVSSASILVKTLKRLDKKFSLITPNIISQNILQDEISRGLNEVLVFLNISSNNLEYFNNVKNNIFIINSDNISQIPTNSNIKLINPNLSTSPEENACTTSALTYLFAKEISMDNKDLSKIALIGLIDENHKLNPSKINQEIIQDTIDLEIKKGLILYPATRPLKRSLEYSTSPYIPGVTGNGPGTKELLREAKISEEKSLIDLNEKEMSSLITGVILRLAKREKQEDILGDLYILKFFNTKEDIREISVLINSCAKLGHSDTAIAYCLENEKAKQRAIDIYTSYKQELVSGLRIAEKTPSINGKGFVILNMKDRIKNAISDAVCGMLSSSPTYEEGTILIAMTYNKDKIQVQARIAGSGKKDLRDLLEKTATIFKSEHPNNAIEVNGSKNKANCSLDKENELAFIDALKKNFEVEVLKI